MRAHLKSHYERNEIFYQAIRTAVVMIAALIFVLTWELTTA
ncbi:hypothetical protein ABEG75_07720 [Pantoea agglomerans]|jgi:hypothetical protein|nr:MULTISPECIES: hypothetical protein [Pantoea]EFM20562.1 hypothetical protein PanABDRAFT_0970 [Pantoea sp. aB]